METFYLEIIDQLVAQKLAYNFDNFLARRFKYLINYQNKQKTFWHDNSNEIFWGDFGDFQTLW